MHFNDKLDVCDWPQNADCEISCDEVPGKCQNGGCGSSSCSIEFTFPIIGGTLSASVVAQPGKFACCWITGVLGLIPDKAFARSYSNKCC